MMGFDLSLWTNHGAINATKINIVIPSEETVCETILPERDTGTGS
jgi:hypothetical protein